MKVVILFQSRGGNTRRAAVAIATAIHDRGHEVALHPVTDVDYKALAEADLVVVGSWVDGLFFFGQRPAQLSHLNQMPDIYGKRAAVFLTYAFKPGRAIDGMADWAESRGADVIAGQAFHRKQIEDDLDDFIERTLERAEAPSGTPSTI